jgi:hypothetical protein
MNINRVSLCMFQVIKMLIAIIITFLLCWGPKLFLTVLRKVQLEALYHKSVFITKVRCGDVMPEISICYKGTLWGCYVTNHAVLHM